MSYVVGIDEFFKNSTSVGGARSTTGIVVGGNMVEESEVRDIRGVGDWKPDQQREGMVRAHGNANLVLQNKSFIELAKRDANGKLTEFDIEGGNADEGIIHKNCKIDTLTLECVAGAELMAAASWKSLYSTAGSSGSHTPSTDNVLEWYEGAIAGFGAIEVYGFTFNASHNVDWKGVIDNTLTPKRRAKYLIEKSQNLSVNLRMEQIEATDLTATDLALIASVTFTFTGANTVTLTLTNLKRGVHERPLTPAELIEHGSNYSVEDFNIS